MNDVSINIPAEQFEYFNRVVRNGLQKTKLPPDAKEQLENWWNAESEFVGDEIDKLNKVD